MHKIHLLSPLVQGQTVTFQWHVEPASDLYRRTHFSINFPSCIDLSRVPKRLWWDIFILCLHPHWLLLRPCEIHLPLKLGASLRQFWLQLLQNDFDTLYAYGPANINDNFLGIAIVDGDLDVPYDKVTGSGCGTAFSGGKDSLLQAALLLELTDRPLLVATTAPMPPLEDHITARRRQVFDTIQTRRNPHFVETRSDFRSSWHNSFAARLGYHVAVNELTDTFLYTASLLAVGAATGATRLFVASETELQESAMIGEKIVQHSHYMYSAATQRALARMLAPYGFELGSLTWPLHSMQVQQLLWARYPDLCDLQYSCWRVRDGEATCSQCEQCLRIAVTALERGDDPQRIGINLRKVVSFASKWVPYATRFSTSSLPQDEAADLLGARVADSIRRTSLIHVGLTLARAASPPRVRVTLKTAYDFHQLRRRFRNLPRPPRMGVREAFFDWLDADLRDSLIAIYTCYFPREPRRKHMGAYERSRALTLRATYCLD
jgi:hypothetical protein